MIRDKLTTKYFVVNQWVRIVYSMNVIVEWIDWMIDWLNHNELIEQLIKQIINNWLLLLYTVHYTLYTGRGIVPISGSFYTKASPCRPRANFHSKQ